MVYESVWNLGEKLGGASLQGRFPNSIPLLAMKFLSASIRDWRDWEWLHGWFDRPLWLRGLIAMTMLVGLAWFAARPGYSMFKAWRTERNLEAAAVACQAHDYATARDLALAVLQAGDSRVEVSRILETAMTALRDDRSLAAASNLFHHPQATAADRLTAFRQIVMAAPFGEMKAHFDRIPPAERDSKPIRLALADRVLLDGSFTEALEVLQALPLEPPDADVAARRIRAWIGLDTAKSASLAQTRIVYFWKLVPEHVADWCALLESVPIARLDPWILEPMRSWLARGRPNRPGQGELMEARIQWKAANTSEAAAEVVTAAVARWKVAAPLALCEFLAAVGDLERLAATFDDGAVEGMPDLILARIKALLQLGRDRELAITLKTFAGSLGQLDFLAYSAVAAHLAKNAPEAFMWVEKAISDANDSPQPDALLQLHPLFLHAGMTQAADRTLLAAIKSGRGRLPSFRAICSLLDSLAAQGLERDIIAVLKRYLELEPWQPQIPSRYGYLAALLGIEDVAALVPQLERLAAQFPDHNQTLASLATLHLLADQIERAQDCWRQLAIPPEDLAPGFRAAFLVTEVLAGKRAPKDPQIRDFPWATLLPCERARFSAMLDSAIHPDPQSQ